MKRSKTPKGCANCNTVRYRIHAKGYCRDCYGLVRRRAQIQAWDWDNPKTFKGYPHGYPLPGKVPSKIPSDSWMHPRNEFLALKQRKLEEIDNRLRSLWDRELTLSGPIDGMEIELMLRNLAQRAGSRDRNLHSGIASAVTYYFSQKQRQILFEWFNEIEESAPWGPRRRWRRFPSIQVPDTLIGTDSHTPMVNAGILAAHRPGAIMDKSGRHFVATN